MRLIALEESPTALAAGESHFFVGFGYPAQQEKSRSLTGSLFLKTLFKTPGL